MDMGLIVLIKTEKFDDLDLKLLSAVVILHMEYLILDFF